MTVPPWRDLRAPAGGAGSRLGVRRRAIMMMTRMQSMEVIMGGHVNWFITKCLLLMVGSYSRITNARTNRAGKGGKAGEERGKKDDKGRRGGWDILGPATRPMNP